MTAPPGIRPWDARMGRDIIGYAPANASTRKAVSGWRAVHPRKPVARRGGARLLAGWATGRWFGGAGTVVVFMMVLRSRRSRVRALDEPLVLDRFTVPACPVEGLSDAVAPAVVAC
jgi:hypothetical protein